MADSPKSKGTTKKFNARYATGKVHSMRLFGMRVNVDWEDFQAYLHEAGSPASFYFVFHDKPLDDEPFGRVGNRHPTAFKESDFIRSADGYPELQIEIQMPFSGPEMDRKLLSMVYTRELKNPACWVFRNRILSELHSLWEKVKQDSQETDKRAAVDPRLNNFGLYQITEPFGKKPAIPTLYAWLLPRVPAYFDCHMHIQSNHCAPLPLIWEKLPVSIQPGWGSMDGIGKWLMSETGRIGAMSTTEIGNEAVKQLGKAIGERIVSYNYHDQTMAKVLTPLPMDMDFGHFRGYEGKSIYKEESDNFYYCPSPFSEVKTKVSKKEGLKYERFRTQIDSHVSTGMHKESLWKVLAYYHYDPRRWNDPVHWQIPLRDIVSSKQRGTKPFIGIKLYTSLGYRPLDPKLSCIEKLYGYCEQMEIPIMNHCTSEGMYTHERDFYYDLLKKENDFKKNPLIEDTQRKHDKWYPISASSRLEFNPHAQELGRLKTLWFEENFVHPKAWKAVAKKFPKLKVCLAHFMGNSRWGNSKVKNGNSYQGAVYGFKANLKTGIIDISKTSDWILSLLDLIVEGNRFHSDISFFVVDKHSEEAFINFLVWAGKWKPFILDRILWGTDWPLLEIGTDLHAPLFDTFTTNLIERLNRVDKSLWFRFSLINPARFLNIKGLSKNISSVYGAGNIPDWVNQLPGDLEDFLTSRKKKVP